MKIKIFPVGTVVKVGYDDNLYMIISQYLLTMKNNTVFYCDGMIAGASICAPLGSWIGEALSEDVANGVLKDEK